MFLPCTRILPSYCRRKLKFTVNQRRVCGSKMMMMMMYSSYSQLEQQRWFNTSKVVTTKLCDDGDYSTRQQRLDYLTSLRIDPGLDRGIVRALRSIYHGNKKDITVDQLKTFGEPGLQALAASVAAEDNNNNNEATTTSSSSCNENQNDDSQDSSSSLNNTNTNNTNKNVTTSMPVTIRVPHHKTEFDLEHWHLGDSLLQAAQDYPELMSEYMEGTCGGTMSCCTCHVYLDPHDYYHQSSSSSSVVSSTTNDVVSEAEQDMLDLAHEPRDGSSRLACQVVLTRKLLDQYDVAVDNNNNNNNMNTKHDDSSTTPKMVVTIPSGVNNVWK